MSEKISTPLSPLKKIVGKLMMLMSVQVYAPKSHINQKSLTIKNNPVIRLTIGLNDPAFDSLHLIRKDTSLSGLFVLDGRFTILEKLRLLADNTMSFSKPLKNPGQASGSVNVIDPVTKKAIASTKLSQIKNNKGQPIDYSNKTWQSLFVNNSESTGTDVNADTSSGTTTSDLLVVASFSKIAGDILNRVKKASSASGGKLSLANITDFSNKKLPTILILFEMLNLYSAFEAVKKSKSDKDTIKNATKLSLAAVTLPFSIVEASTKLISAERTVVGISKVIGDDLALKLIYSDKTRVGFRSFSILAKTGIGFAGIGALMSGWDSFDAFIADDDDAAIAYGIQAVCRYWFSSCSLWRLSW